MCTKVSVPVCGSDRARCKATGRGGSRAGVGPERPPAGGRRATDHATVSSKPQLCAHPPRHSPKHIPVPDSRVHAPRESLHSNLEFANIPNYHFFSNANHFRKKLQILAANG